jgi:hypothetical protein
MSENTYSLASGSGYLFSNDADFADAHNAAAALSVWIDQPAYYVDQEGPGAGLGWAVYRSALMFDLTDLAGATVTAASLYFTFAYMESSAANLTIHAVDGAFSVPIVVADFGDLLTETTSLGSVAITTEGDYAIVLNTGVINPGGVTKIALRTALDIANTQESKGGGVSGVSLVVSFLAGAADRTKTVKDIPTLEAIRNVEIMAQGRLYVNEVGNLAYESRFRRNP